MSSVQTHPFQLQEALFSLSRDMANVQDKEGLQLVLKHHFTINGFNGDLLIFILNEDGRSYSVFLQPPLAGHPLMPGTRYHYPDGCLDKVLRANDPIILCLQELQEQTVIPDYISNLARSGISWITAVQLGRHNGALFLLSPIPQNYTPAQLHLLQGIAHLASHTVFRLLEQEARQQEELEKQLLLSLSMEIASCRSKEDIQHIVSTRLSRYFQFNEIMICLDNNDGLTHSNYIHTISEATRSHPDFAKGAAQLYYIHDDIHETIEQSEQPVVFDMDELVKRKHRPFYIDFFYNNNIRELIGIPMRVNNESFGVVHIYIKHKHRFTEPQLRLAQAVCSQIAIAVSNIRAYDKIQTQLEEINNYKAKLEEENLYLQEQIKNATSYTDIIGNSPALHHVFQLVAKVCSTDSTVLIQGETGTGKELIARAIHNSSPRKHKLLVKVNCAAMPVHLIESELFGHERGSFTGAVERHIGKFELADNGTLFLDEIGEMAPELQVKLLRAIQEKEIERIGGKRPIKTDVRIIAATNRNLQEDVDAGRFRSDLFYRLNVFPIELPALRERKEDIPVLAYHFLQQFCHRNGKNIRQISAQALNSLIGYDWPGNIRELEHQIQRSVILASGNIISEIYLPRPGSATALLQLDDGTVKTIQEAERDHILSILKKTNGRIKGPHGAAELLRIPPTTLYSKMKKLGIR